MKLWQNVLLLVLCKISRLNFLWPKVRHCATSLQKISLFQAFPLLFEAGKNQQPLMFLSLSLLLAGNEDTASEVLAATIQGGRPGWGYNWPREEGGVDRTQRYHLPSWEDGEFLEQSNPWAGSTPGCFSCMSWQSLSFTPLGCGIFVIELISTVI